MKRMQSCRLGAKFACKCGHGVVSKSGYNVKHVCYEVTCACGKIYHVSNTGRYWPASGSQD